jgi:hypothetical protein
MEQVTRPGNTTGDSRQVTHDWRSTLMLLVRIFNFVNLYSVVVEQDVILGIETILQVVSVED